MSSIYDYYNDDNDNYDDDDVDGGGGGDSVSKYTYVNVINVLRYEV